MADPAADTELVSRRDAFVERLFEATLGAFDLFAVYLGDRLGYYQALADGGPLNSPALAARTGTNERCAREWLEQQAISGILEVENAAAPPGERRYALPAAYVEPLTDPNSMVAMAPMAQIFAGTVRPLDAIVAAFRTGEGVPYEAYGEDLRVGQARATRPSFVNALARDWIPAMPDVHTRLMTEPPARVADIGMGLGWSSIAIARAYPAVLVDGFDLDEASVQEATANAAANGVADRVSFQVRDAGDLALAGQYDLACAFECIHDMPDPVRTLAAMGRLVGQRGTVLIVDERVADEFGAIGDGVERMMYGFSVFHCLLVGMTERPSAETGTVIRASTMRRYAEEAGFSRVEVLPVEHDTFRLYRLNA
jgi:2-polyprenyl-3-methyl-5-hydroxy-6-metoxy-1,4-benzoquinol methylase